MSFIQCLAAAPESHEQQLLDIDWTLAVQLGLFLLILAVLTKLLWKPYLRVRDERVSRIDGDYQAAQKIESEAGERLARCEATVAQAKAEGSRERGAARSRAQAKEAELIAAAQAESQKTLAEATSRVQAALDAERVKLATRAQELGKQAATRVLGREVV